MGRRKVQRDYILSGGVSARAAGDRGEDGDTLNKHARVADHRGSRYQYGDPALPPALGTPSRRRVAHGSVGEEGLPDGRNGRSPVGLLEKNCPPSPQ
eukprot:15474053-Alexandrium_andersonii.AAC.1